MQPLEIEYVEHGPRRGAVRLALNRAREDRFTERLRRGGGKQRIAELILGLSSEGDRVIDAGANVGTVAAPVASRGRHVLAIEAMAENYVLLLQTAVVNQLSTLVPVHAAVAESPGLVEIEGGSAYARVAVSDEPGSAPAVTIDALASAHGFDDAAVVKLDVEGSELNALAGMRSLLAAETLRHVVFEANGAHCARVGHRPQQLIDVLVDHGFSVALIHQRQVVPVSGLAFQALGNADYLASRPGLPLPPEYGRGTFGSDDQVAGVVEALENANRAYRRFMLDELRYAPAAIRRNPAVRDLLEVAAADEALGTSSRDNAEELLAN